jgi:hypothetical protein
MTLVCKVALRLFKSFEFILYILNKLVTLIESKLITSFLNTQKIKKIIKKKYVRLTDYIFSIWSDKFNILYDSYKYIFMLGI